jgi:DNA-binding beta-propeller fold protein YncE
MMLKRLLVILSLPFAVATFPLQALQGQQPSAVGSLLVLSKGDLAMSVVDPATLKVVGKVPSGPDPHEIVASSDGRMAYIANYNGGGNIITPVDLAAMKALTPIDLGPLRAPHGLDYVANKLWFTAEGAKVIGSYDPATQKVDWVLGTGQNRTHMLYVWPDVSRIVTSNVSSATLTIIEKTTGGGRGRGGPQTDWDETVVAVGRGAEGFDVSPDRKEIWAANAQDGTISIVDVASKKVLDTLQAKVNGANRLKFTPDGKHVFVSSLGGPEVAIFEAATKRDVKRLKTGGTGAAGIQMQPDGMRAYVSCTPNDYVAVVDLKTLEIAGKIEAGRQPDGLAWVARR